MAEFCETIKKIAVLQESGTGRIKTELRLLKYPTRDGEYYDIRKWEYSEDGTERMLKGISLNYEAWECLKLAIAEMDKDG